MTWGELKKKIDEGLAAAGGDDSTPVWYVDTSFPDGDILVEIDPDSGMAAVTA